MRRNGNAVLAGLLILLAAAMPARAVTVQEVRSESGVTAWLVEDHSLPILSLRATFRQAGSAYDPPGREGLAYMAGELLTEGAGNLSALAFRERLEARAIRMAFGADQDMFSLSLETLSEHRQAAAELLQMALRAPRFDDAAIMRVRASALSALRQLEEDPAYVASRALAQAVFAGHPYARPLRGTASSLRALKRSDLTGFARRQLARDRVVVTAAGDITPAQLAAMLDAIFGTLPQHGDRPIEIAQARFATGKTIVAVRDIPQTVVAFALPGVQRDSPDYIPAYVLNHILGGGDLTSQLSQEIREKRGLAYYAYTALQPLQRGALVVGQFSTRHEKATHAQQVMVQTLSGLAKNGVSPQELQDAKDYLVGSFPLELDSNRELSAFLMTMRLHALGIDYLNRREGLIRGVTQEQINAIARRLLTTSQLTVVIVGKAPSTVTPNSKDKPSV